MRIKFLPAENGDSILLNFVDSEGSPRNVLIDGGKTSTYFGKTRRAGPLKKEIDDIKLRKERIDLLILSHIDNDHIEGLLRWLELDKKASKIINEVWFNSGKAIAKYLKQPENDHLNLFLADGLNVFTGVDEGIEFQGYLDKHQLLKYCIIKKSKEWEHFGINIKVLSPTNKQLVLARTGDPDHLNIHSQALKRSRCFHFSEFHKLSARTASIYSVLQFQHTLFTHDPIKLFMVDQKAVPL